MPDKLNWPTINVLRHYRGVAGGWATGGLSPLLPEFLEVKNITVCVLKNI